MKKINILLSISLTIMMLGFTSTVLATAYGPTLMVSQSDKTLVLQFNTNDPGNWKEFSGKDINSIVVNFYLDDNAFPTPVTPRHISYADSQVKLFFTITEIPGASASAINVEGTTSLGDSFFASGPGFAWRRR